MRVALRTSEDRDRLEKLCDGARDAKQRDRYRVALLVSDQTREHETEQIMTMLDRSRGFVQRWAYAYRDGGIEALSPRPQPGAAPKLRRDQEQRFIERLKKGPTQADGGVCTLRGKDAVRILESEFAARYSLGGAYDLLHRLGFSCLRPRPRHRKNDPQAMQQWLERAPFLSSRFKSSIRTRQSRFGSRTRPASDSKEH
jgi:transposase